MRGLRAALMRIRNLAGRTRAERDLTDELEAHLQIHIDDNLRAGMPAAEARRSALLRVGGMQMTRDLVRDQQRVLWLETLVRDVRFGFRLLCKSPGFAAIAITTLAVAIGANTAVYTLVDHALLRPLPYPEPDRLATISRHFERGSQSGDSYSQNGVTWLAVREVASLDAAVVGSVGGVNLVAGSQTSYVQQQRVSAGFFRVLGIPPALGREFTTDEDQAGGRAVVVLSHALWVRAFAADTAVLGRDVTLRGEPSTIVGVMPQDFRPTTPADLWTPLRPSTQGEGAGQNYQVYARLRPGAAWPNVRGEVESAGAKLVRERFQLPPDVRLSFRLLPLQQMMTSETRQPLLVLWAAVGIVLLIGCANIAGLMIVRASARAPEIATRIALGGGRASIVRQLLAESVVLAACGGAAGIGLGYALARTLSVRLADITTLPTTPDLRVLLIATAASLLTSVVFGLLPAFQASRIDVRGMLVETGGASIAGAARHWPSRLLVAGQMALGIVLVVGAGLLVRNFTRLTQLEPGFDPTNVTTGTVSLQDARYQTATSVNDLFARSLARIRLTPGVERAAVALTLPYERALNNGWRFEGEATGRPEVISLTYVTPDYFDALRIPTRTGRVLNDRDTGASPLVVVVNETFVSRYSRDVNPIGRRLLLGGGRPVEIVGVVGAIQQRPGFGNYGPVAPVPSAYVPASQGTDGGFRIVHTWFEPSWIVRASDPRTTIVPALREALREVDPLLPFNQFRTMEDVRGEAVLMARIQAALLGTLAGIALLLCSLGVYGLVANSVAERQREFGVRLALGATPLQIIRTATAPALALSVSGAVAGLLIAAGGTRLMQQLVFGVSVGDPLTFGLAAGVVILTACVAALVPAARTLRTSVVATLNNR